MNWCLLPMRESGTHMRLEGPAPDPSIRWRRRATAF